MTAAGDRVHNTTPTTMPKATRSSDSEPNKVKWRNITKLYMAYWLNVQSGHKIVKARQKKSSPPLTPFKSWRALPYAATLACCTGGGCRGGQLGARATRRWGGGPPGAQEAAARRSSRPEHQQKKA